MLWRRWRVIMHFHSFTFEVGSIYIFSMWWRIWFIADDKLCARIIMIIIPIDFAIIIDDAGSMFWYDLKHLQWRMDLQHFDTDLRRSLDSLSCWLGSPQVVPIIQLYNMYNNHWFAPGKLRSTHDDDQSEWSCLVFCTKSFWCSFCWVW